MGWVGMKQREKGTKRASKHVGLFPELMGRPRGKNVGPNWPPVPQDVSAVMAVASQFSHQSVKSWSWFVHVAHLHKLLEVWRVLW